jgi:hypothetical protein
MLLIVVFIGLKNVKTLAVCVAALTILVSGTWQRLDYYSYPDRLEVRNSRSLSSYSLSLFGEYLPSGGSLLTPDPSSSAVFSEWKPKIDEFIQEHDEVSPLLWDYVDHTRRHLNMWKRLKKMA